MDEMREAFEIWYMRVHAATQEDFFRSVHGNLYLVEEIQDSFEAFEAGTKWKEKRNE